MITQHARGREQKLHERIGGQLSFSLNELGRLSECFEFFWVTETGTIVLAGKLSGPVSWQVPPLIDGILLYHQLEESNPLMVS